jgi:GT2 family glycosyltransferase
MSAPSVVAVVATYRRAAEIRRLVESLEKSAVPLAGAIVVDNAEDPATADALKSAATLRIERDAPGKNLGCGGGLALAEKRALERFPGLTHVWILDDDAVVEPDTLGATLAAMERENAAVAHPLVIDAQGRVGWPPGVLDRALLRAMLSAPAPAEFHATHGDAPKPFSWCQGIALLVTREMLTTLGFHRTDYWVRGEDLEFSLRITHRHRGILVPTARVLHLPPPETAASRDHEYTKHRAMLQNIAYTSLRLPHGRRIARTIPGNTLRFLRTWGWTPRVLAEAFASLTRGGLLGKPAGA